VITTRGRRAIAAGVDVAHPACALTTAQGLNQIMDPGAAAWPCHAARVALACSDHHGFIASLIGIGGIRIKAIAINAEQRAAVAGFE